MNVQIISPHFLEEDHKQFSWVHYIKSVLFEKEEKASGNKIRQNITIQEGIQKEIAQAIIKQIKNKKLKVQPSIQGDQIRISGKKRDELQEAISFLKTLDLTIPIDFTNFRD